MHLSPCVPRAVWHRRLLSSAFNRLLVQNPAQAGLHTTIAKETNGCFCLEVFGCGSRGALAVENIWRLASSRAEAKAAVEA